MINSILCPACGAKGKVTYKKKNDIYVVRCTRCRLEFGQVNVTYDIDRCGRMTPQKRWRVITMRAPGMGEINIMSRHRISDEQMEEILNKHGGIDIDLDKEFGTIISANVITSVYSTDCRERAEEVLNRLNDGHDLLSALCPESEADE